MRDCVYVYVYVYVCVRACERACLREGEKERVCVYIYESALKVDLLGRRRL